MCGCVCCVSAPQDFIHHPITTELLHNGELLQVSQANCWAHPPPAWPLAARDTPSPAADAVLERSLYPSHVIVSSLLSAQQHAMNFAALLQVLGLTNYSHWDKAADLRACMLKDEAIAGMCRRVVVGEQQPVCNTVSVAHVLAQHCILCQVADVTHQHTAHRLCVAVVLPMQRSCCSLA